MLTLACSHLVFSLFELRILLQILPLLPFIRPHRLQIVCRVCHLEMGMEPIIMEFYSSLTWITDFSKPHCASCQRKPRRNTMEYLGQVEL